MPTLSRRTVATFAASVGLLAALGFAVAGHVAADDTNIVKALRAGGFVIVVRHGATFPDQADTDPLNFDNIAAQRNLPAHRTAPHERDAEAAAASRGAPRGATAARPGAVVRGPESRRDGATAGGGTAPAGQ